MKQLRIFLLSGLLLNSFFHGISAQGPMDTMQVLNSKQQGIIAISALAAKGDLLQLPTALNGGLDAGLTVNQIKEVLVHLYAYCGFPRSIRGLQTFMEVLTDRKAKGITDNMGREVSPIQEKEDKYNRGKRVLGELTKMTQSDTLTGYSAFVPAIDTFLKEHLFADIFERDVLSYAERELVTVSVLSAIGGVEPMLRSHLQICMNVGLTANQLQHFVSILKSTAGKKEAKSAQSVLDEVLKNNPSQQTEINK